MTGKMSRFGLGSRIYGLGSMKPRQQQVFPKQRSFADVLSFLGGAWGGLSSVLRFPSAAAANPDLSMCFVLSQAFMHHTCPIMDKFRNGPITKIDRRTNINPPINHSVSESVTQAVN